MRRVDLRLRGRWLVIGLLGALAAAGRWLTIGRDAILDSHDQARFFVTSAGDAGPGSLREAIFGADRAAQAATIVLRTPRIQLESALPPLVNPRGVRIDARELATEIDAAASLGQSVLEVRSPGSSVEGLRIRGALGSAVLVRAPHVRIDRVTIRESVDGVVLAQEASDVVVENSRFESNDTGLRIGDALPRVTVRNNTFVRHAQAGIRAVIPRPAATSELQIHSNRFEDDRISLIMIHLNGRIENNVFIGAREAAIFLMGRGAIVRRNRTRDGAQLGIFADQTDDAIIENNEVDHNAAVGLLVRAGDGTTARNNRLYSNGYGIAVVFGGANRPHIVRDNLLFGHTQDALYIIGASPVLTRNQALSSRLAALRILEFVPLRGSRLPADPHLDGNVFQRNLLDAPVRGEYRVTADEAGSRR